jgi:hypothetical protein
VTEVNARSGASAVEQGAAPLVCLSSAEVGVSRAVVLPLEREQVG